MTTFEHYAHSARFLLGSIANTANEYLALLSRPELKDIRTGTLQGRPVWLTQLEALCSALAKELDTARRGAVL